MKTYRPLLKDKATLADTHQPVDPESRLTYDSLCEGFNLPTQTEGSIKRKADNNSSPENNQKNNTIYGVESLIDGWGGKICQGSGFSVRPGKSEWHVQ